MQPSQLQFLVDLVRIGTAVAVFFVVLPRLFLSKVLSKRSVDSLELTWLGVTCSGTVYVLLVHALVLAGAFDPVSLLVCVLALAGIGLLLTYRQVGPSRSYADLLRHLEKGDWGYGLRGGVRSRMLITGGVGSAAGILGGLVLAVAAVRVRPFLMSPNAYSFTFYETLHGVKALQLGELYPGGVLQERGMHAFGLAVHVLSQVHEDTVVRLLGLVSALLLAYTIYAVTRSMTDRSWAGVVSAALFGVAGVSQLPLGATLHVSADPSVLATVFLLPAIYFAGRYVERGRRNLLVVASGALIACAAIDISVAAFGGALLMVQAVSGWMVSSTRRRSLRAGHVLAVNAALFLAIVHGVWSASYLVQPVDPQAVPYFQVVAETARSVASMPPVNSKLVLGALGAVALLGLIGTIDTDPDRATAARTLAIGGGATTLLAAFPALASDLGMEPRESILLMDVFVCIALGLILAYLWRVLAWFLVPRKTDAERREAAFVLGSLVLCGSIWLAVPPPVLDHERIQPSAYAEAYEAARAGSTPMQWSVVGHRGLNVRMQNEGYYVGYERFLDEFDLDAYLRKDTTNTWTDELYVFVDRRPNQPVVRAELQPPTPEVTRRIARWCQNRRERSDHVQIFFESEYLRVYRIARRPDEPAPKGNLAAMP